MRKLPLILNAPLLGTALFVSPGQPYAAADEPSPAQMAPSGPRIRNAPIARVAKVWEHLFGGPVTVSDRAQARRVSMDISSSSKDELRKKFIAALRENRIYVIEEADGVLFDTQPVASAAK